MIAEHVVIELLSVIYHFCVFTVSPNYLQINNAAVLTNFNRISEQANLICAAWWELPVFHLMQMLLSSATKNEILTLQRSLQSLCGPTRAAPTGQDMDTQLISFPAYQPWTENRYLAISERHWSGIKPCVSVWVEGPKHHPDNEHPIWSRVSLVLFFKIIMFLWHNWRTNRSLNLTTSLFMHKLNQIAIRHFFIKNCYSHQWF